MKKTGVTAILILLYIGLIFSQNLTQTIRGTILDEDRRWPMPMKAMRTRYLNPN